MCQTLMALMSSYSYMTIYKNYNEVSIHQKSAREIIIIKKIISLVMNVLNYRIVPDCSICQVPCLRGYTLTAVLAWVLRLLCSKNKLHTSSIANSMHIERSIHVWVGISFQMEDEVELNVLFISLIMLGITWFHIQIFSTLF